MTRLMNENIKVVLQEAAEPGFREIGKFVHQHVKAFTEKVPYDELFTKEN
jgi:hypothetical protein